MLRKVMAIKKTWQAIHRELTRLALQRAALDAEEAYWLREGHAVRVWAQAGFATYAEYLEGEVGYRRGTARERIRAALALGELRAMTEALSEGRIPWTAVRELSRVAIGDTEDAWLAAAAGHSVRQIEAMVAGLSRGDLPGAGRERGAERHVLRFEVSGATYAAFREAAEVLTKQAGSSLSHDELFGLITRQVLAGETGNAGDPGRASYQLAYRQCETCERTMAQGAGREVEVDSVTAEMIACDVQHVTTPHVGRATQSVTPAKRRAVMHRDRGRCAVPGCGLSAYVDVHHIDRQTDGGGHDMENLTLVCYGHHRAVHEGRIHIERRDGHIVCTHADGTPYGQARAIDPDELERRAQALEALVDAGFRDREARALIALDGSAARGR
jgi:5-methylcytosine-specific restriction endonuclease McrA